VAEVADNSTIPANVRGAGKHNQGGYMRRTRFDQAGWNCGYTIRAVLSLAGLVLALAAGSRAQIDRAGLSGTVTDPSGRVLPQTHVTAVQISTGLERKTTSSAAGVYDIPELPVGIYTVTFAHEGFKTLTFVDVEEVIGRTRTLNANLEVSGRDERL